MVTLNKTTIVWFAILLTSSVCSGNTTTPAVAPEGHYFLEISTSVQTLYIKKHNMWFTSSSDNRTVSYDSDAFVTIEKGDRKKGQFVKPPVCEENKSYCTVQIKVGGEGALTMVSLYTLFGVQMTSVIKSYEIKSVGSKLIATVPNGWSLTEPAK